MRIPGFMAAIIGRFRPEKEPVFRDERYEWTGFHVDYPTEDEARAGAAHAIGVCLAHLYGQLYRDGRHVDLYTFRARNPGFIAGELFPGRDVAIDETYCSRDELKGRRESSHSTDGPHPESRQAGKA